MMNKYLSLFRKSEVFTSLEILLLIVAWDLKKMFFPIPISIHLTLFSTFWNQVDMLQPLANLLSPCQECFSSAESGMEQLRRQEGRTPEFHSLPCAL